MPRRQALGSTEQGNLGRSLSPWAVRDVQSFHFLSYDFPFPWSFVAACSGKARQGNQTTSDDSGDYDLRCNQCLSADDVTEILRCHRLCTAPHL